MPRSDRIVQLRMATLAQIAAELRDRAVVACSGCNGQGIVADHPYFCRTCNGTGYEPWPELRAVADLLAAVDGTLPV